MAGPTTGLKASAAFEVRPVRSQVVLVAITIAAIFALVLAAALLAMDKSSGWPFLAISVLLCGAVVWCWHQSHRDADLAGSYPTKVVLPDGANISTDSRLLGSAEGFRQFGTVVEALALRTPLPEPSGLTGPGAIPIPNTSQEAIAKVALINSITQDGHNQAIDALRRQLAGGSIVQPPDDGRHLPDSAKGLVDDSNTNVHQ